MRWATCAWVSPSRVRCSASVRARFLAASAAAPRETFSALPGKNSSRNDCGPVNAWAAASGAWPGPDARQDARGQGDGFAVMIVDRVVSLQHGDQQRGASRLDGEQDADVTVTGRPGPQLQQVPGRGWPRSSCSI